MIARSLRNQGRRWSWIGFGVLIAACIVVLLIAPWLRDVVGSFLVSSSVYQDYALIPRDVLIARLNAAEHAVNETKYQAVLYSDVQKKYQALQREVGMHPAATYAVAAVAARPPKTVYDTLLITSGTADGVVVGDVATASGFVIGAVTSVSAHSAVVQLVTAPGQQRDATLGTPTAIVTLTGQGGGAFETSIPNAVSVAPGSVATDSQTGFGIAVVASVETRQIDTTATVRLSLPVALGEVDSVSLVHRTLQ